MSKLKRSCLKFPPRTRYLYYYCYLHYLYDLSVFSDKSLHTRTVAKQAATTSFPFLFSSPKNHPEKRLQLHSAQAPPVYTHTTRSPSKSDMAICIGIGRCLSNGGIIEQGFNSAFAPFFFFFRKPLFVILFSENCRKRVVRVVGSSGGPFEW